VFCVCVFLSCFLSGVFFRLCFKEFEGVFGFRVFEDPVMRGEEKRAAKGRRCVRFFVCLFSFLDALLHLLSCRLVCRDDSWQKKFSSFVSFGSGILKVSSGRE